MMTKHARILTGAQMAALRPYHEHLRRMHDSNYNKNLTTGVFNALKAVYDDVTGRENYINGACAACVTDLLRTLAGWYYDTMDAEGEIRMADLRAREAARDAEFQRMKAEELAKLEARAREKMAEAEARLAEAEALKAEAEREAEAARARAKEAAAVAAENPEAEVVEAEALIKPENGAEAGQISPSTPGAGKGTAEPVKPEKTAGKSKTVKPKTN